jgi:predicted TIM-barrel fold metal-dependent hydrolase
VTKACLPPNPTVRPPSFAVPSGAWDCHIHAIGDPARFPLAPDRSYTPALVAIEAYVELMDQLGIAHAVLVQPSIYGTDNRAMVDALVHHPERFRGVAVIGADVSDDALDDLHRHGVRGVRANLLNRGGISLADAVALAPRLAERNWHLQLQVDVSSFDAFDAVAALPVELVIDHFGYMPIGKGADEPGFRRLVSLVEAGRCYVKLSSANRLAHWRREGYGAVAPLARALVDANPARLLWASDWPHTGLLDDMPDDGELLSLLGEWIPDAATRKRVLVDNPAALYGH